jgi:hypothetical protein
VRSQFRFGAGSRVQFGYARQEVGWGLGLGCVWGVKTSETVSARRGRGLAARSVLGRRRGGGGSTHSFITHKHVRSLFSHTHSPPSTPVGRSVEKQVMTAVASRGIPSAGCLVRPTAGFISLHLNNDAAVSGGPCTKLQPVDLVSTPVPPPHPHTHTSHCQAG